VIRNDLVLSFIPILLPRSLALLLSCPLALSLSRWNEMELSFIPIWLSGSRSLSQLRERE